MTTGKLKTFALIEGVKKSAENKFSKYNYADLADINEVINPYLIENNLNVSHSIEDSIMVTKLLDGLNILLETKSKIILEPDAKNHKHDYGAAITYSRKYNLKMMFNLSECDDDAHKAPPPPSKKPSIQTIDIQTLISTKAMLEALSNLSPEQKSKLEQINNELIRREAGK